MCLKVGDIMSQNPLVVNDAAAIIVRQNFNSALNTLVTNNLGAGEPSPTYEGMFWADSNNNLLKQRTPDNQSWIIIGPLTLPGWGLNTPVGAMLPFRGSFNGKNPIDRLTSAVYTNWHICDGTDGTIDLRDKFILCAGTVHAAGSSGGEETHVLAVTEMPSHSHDFSSGSLAFTPSGPGQNANNTGGGGGGTLASISNSGGGLAHNNMPPYYAMAYIERIL